MSSENYEEYKTYDLKDMCKERGISGYSRKKKEELIQLLKDDDKKKTNLYKDETKDKENEELKYEERDNEKESINDHTDLSKDDLIELCNQRDIKYAKSYTKTQLIDLLNGKEIKKRYNCNFPNCAYETTQSCSLNSHKNRIHTENKKER